MSFKTLLKLKRTEIVEYSRFDEFLDLCFEISDYFSFTVRHFHDQDEGDYKNFLWELDPFFLEKIRTMQWFGLGVPRRAPLEVCIFKTAEQAKAILQKYFDNLFLRERNPDGTFAQMLKELPEDLCFYYGKELLVGTVSHEHMCHIFSPNEQITGKFQKICSWEELDYTKCNHIMPSRIDDNKYLRMDSLYVRLQAIRNNPTRFLEKKSLEYLYHFIAGHHAGADMGPAAENESGVDYRSCLNRWNFQRFVWLHYRDDFIKGENWQMIISRHSNSQEEAFDTFYELFDEFLEEHKDWRETDEADD